MCQSVLRRHLQLTLHLLAPQQQTARHTLVGKSAVFPFLFLCVSVRFPLDCKYYLDKCFFYFSVCAENIADKHGFCWCHNFCDVWYWFCPALGYMCRKCFETRQKLKARLPTREDISRCVLFSFKFKKKQTKNPAKNFLSPLLLGFGNRCIQPKGPRERPLEWTWWNDPSARPLTVLTGDGLYQSPLAGPKTKLIDATQTDSTILHRNTFCVTLCRHPLQTELLLLLPPSFKVPLCKAEEHLLVKWLVHFRTKPTFSCSACWCWRFLTSLDADLGSVWLLSC